MTTEQHILDAILEMEKRGVEPTMEDFEAMAELMEEESKQKEEINMELNSELDRLQKWSVIDSELQRAKQKHPNFPEDMFRQLAIMQEEAGEVTKATLHYHYEGGRLKDVIWELIQTAAMCMRMIEAIERKEDIINNG